MTLFSPHSTNHHLFCKSYFGVYCTTSPCSVGVVGYQHIMQVIVQLIGRYIYWIVSHVGRPNLSPLEIIGLMQWDYKVGIQFACDRIKTMIWNPRYISCAKVAQISL